MNNNNNNTASNGVMSPASSSAAAATVGLKTYFKTPEGRYKLQYEKTHPSALLHYAHGKTVTQVTLAHLKDKPAPSTPTASSSSSFSTSSGVRSAAARLLGGSNGSRALSFVGVNGSSSKSNGGTTRIGSLGASTSSTSMANPNFDGKGTYLIFNVGDAIFISDLNSHDKDPIKSIHFSNSNPVCHAFDQDAKDGHDLLIGLSSGDGGDGAFAVAHADGNLYNKDSAGDSSFPVIKDQTQFSVSHARYNKSNPIARWHICQGSINSISFSNDGAYLATVGRDGSLRVFDYSKEFLVCGGKSYYGALLCCAWSVAPLGTLQPAPSMRDVPKISPSVAHHAYTEPLSGLIFTQESVLTACREGHIKVWVRPDIVESESINSEALLATSLKDKPSLLSKISNSSYK
ncbi:hypothetical protein TanjilG_06250 [Lupinus angustifolius]|uniref:Uncharacterized protein n=1 Tax=Lupinus angustifolius TaxID=3871 RepID=A0A394DNX7_LUPAN|nr:hypothetical protein TanjilG_06250 [Lupinus angustifolius]